MLQNQYLVSHLPVSSITPPWCGSFSYNKSLPTRHVCQYKENSFVFLVSYITHTYGDDIIKCSILTAVIYYKPGFKNKCTVVKAWDCTNCPKATWTSLCKQWEIKSSEHYKCKEVTGGRGETLRGRGVNEKWQQDNKNNDNKKFSITVFTNDQLKCKQLNSLSIFSNIVKWQTCSFSKLWFDVYLCLVHVTQPHNGQTDITREIRCQTQQWTSAHNISKFHTQK